MGKLTGTKTEKNLEAAFAGESQACNKYTYYAAKAKKDGFVGYAAVIEMIARNEREHAKIWFKIRNGGAIRSTEENLEDCISGEHSEWTGMYKTFAAEAREEGFDDIAALFDGVAAVEKIHEEKFRNMLDNILSQGVFSSKIEKRWECLNCGHVHHGDSAPLACPVCSHGREHFSAESII
ncbi:MAG: rubrerythrin family protein [Holosporales bacterium]|jgi:rubrerythrin|nr:rubrerythrin family protein [Holosporales bacterium]